MSSCDDSGPFCSTCWNEMDGECAECLRKEKDAIIDLMTEFMTKRAVWTTYQRWLETKK